MMSHFRLRSGGISRERTLRRKKRSSRNLPSLTIWGRSLLVAAMIRQLMLMGLWLPRRMT